MSSYYDVKELRPNIYRISEYDVFMNLFVGSDKALIFDTGYGVGNLKGEEARF